MDLNEKCVLIEQRLQRDEGQRGIKSIIPDTSQLYPCLSPLLSCSSVLIMTGFPCLFSNPIKIETDGLAGSLAVARSLFFLNKSVTILIDPESVPVLSCLVSWHNEAFGTRISVSSRLDLETDGVISIERPGRSEDGNYYTMRAIKMNDITPFDLVYLDRYSSKVRIAIGDGGNEAGLGMLKEKIQNGIRNGKIIASCSMSDFAIVASTSTWGGYGLAAAVCLAGGIEPVVTVGGEKMVAEKIREIGICDGISGLGNLGVDNLDWEESERVILDIAEICRIR